VTVFVLNQVDKLAPEELVECVGDLADLLKREGVEHPRLVSTSALTGRGIDGLKGVLAESVSHRRAAVQRLEADLNRLVGDLTRVMPAPEVMTVEPVVDSARREGLVDALCDAVGVPAVGEAMESVYGARSIDWVGWPYARWAARLRPDPLSSLRLGDLRGEIGNLVGGAVSAQPAEVDNAVQALGDGLTPGMPEAWRNSVRDAARSSSAQLPQVLSQELSAIAPRLDRVPGWWWLLKIWQYLLVVLLVVGVVWAGTILVYGVLGIGNAPAEPLSDVSALPWLGVTLVSVLGLGLLSAVASRNFVVLGAGGERERLEREMRHRVAFVAEEAVIKPVERELQRYNEFFSAMSVVRR
jgi:hypothetical protein